MNTSFHKKKYITYLGLFLILLTTLFSCVPNKKIVYLQEGNELKGKEEIKTDTILRRHPMQIVEYRIQPLDILHIRFESLTSDEYDFFSKLSPQQQGGMAGGGGGAGGGLYLALLGILVDANGDIEYPVVGKIPLAGLTVFEAESKIQQIASQYMRDVIVRVRLLNFRFTVLGEVTHESTITSFNTRLGMMEAIGLAGGFGELADRSRVKVIRQNGSQSEVFYINLLEEKYLQSPYYFIQQNDIIVVSPLVQRPFRRYFQQNLGIFSSTISSILIVITLLTR